MTLRLLLLCLLCICCQKPVASDVHRVEIKIDERVSDFCARMEIADIFSCRDLARVADSRQFKSNTMLNHNVSGIQKFEGIFRPGSYTYDQKAGLADFVEKLLNKSKADYSFSKTNLLSSKDIIILASIVEKEAVSNQDYKKIARVFLNRLKKNDKLGSCPTVEYALGFHRPFLLFKDLESDSPYNVYRFRGLPPTPIAFFSKEALDAVLNPIAGNDYFFVYDWTTGKLSFTDSYKTHKDNANRARRNFINKYGKENMYKAFPGKFYEMF